MLESALANAPDHLLVMKAAADAHENANDRLGALRIYRRLAEREPGQALAHLGKIAALELEVGSANAAKAAAETLVQRHPGDLDGYRLRSEIAFRLGETREGLDWLERAVRVAVRDVPIRLDLAAALAKYGATDLAAEHYWRCLELAEQFDDKRTIVASLAELARATGTQDRFLDRLRRLRRTDEHSKSLTLCLVEALRDLGDPSGARIELEKLAASSPDDLSVLKMLATLAAGLNDWAAAIGYQERIVALRPRQTISKAWRATIAPKETSQRPRKPCSAWSSRAIATIFAAAVAHAIDQFAFSEAKRLAAAGLRRRPGDWRLSVPGWGRPACDQGQPAPQSRRSRRCCRRQMEVTSSLPLSASSARSPRHRRSKRPHGVRSLQPAGRAMRKTRVNPMAQVGISP